MHTTRALALIPGPQPTEGDSLVTIWNAVHRSVLSGAS